MHLKKQTNIKLFLWKEFHNSLYTKVARVQVLTRVAQCCLALNLKTCHSFFKQSVSRIRINLALRGIESNCIKCICRQRDSELNWRNIFPWRRSLICGLKLEKCRRGRLKLNAFPLAKERERETERETLCATCGTATRRSYSSLSRSRSWTCWCYCCCCTLSISERQLIFHVVSCLLVTLSVCASVCKCVWMCCNAYHDAGANACGKRKLLSWPSDAFCTTDGSKQAWCTIRITWPQLEDDHLTDKWTSECAWVLRYVALFSWFRAVNLPNNLQS